MNLDNLLPGWVTPQTKSESHIHRYSAVGDILAYKRCRRQYGYFGVRGFESVTQTQRYFGVLVHDVLDRIYRDYRATKNLPDEATVGDLVEDAHERLRLAGIRTKDAPDQKKKATELIYRLVVTVGPNFFPHVMKTEYHLERALQTPVGRDYILEGVVDVLSGAVSHDLGLPHATTPDDVEIWDYKSERRPPAQSPRLQEYEYQLRVYAELYRQQTGRFPDRCVLLFVGELGDVTNWDPQVPIYTQCVSLFYIVEPDSTQVGTAMADFHDTVEEIETEKEKPYDQQWLAPTHPVDPATCADCELRFHCDAFPAGGQQAATPL